MYLNATPNLNPNPNLNRNPPLNPPSLGSRPCPARRFGGGGRNRLGRWVAESEQHLLGFGGVALAQLSESESKCVHSNVFLPASAFDAVYERRQINQLAPRVHEIKIENLLPCHNIYWTHFSHPLF